MKTGETAASSSHRLPSFLQYPSFLFLLFLASNYPPLHSQLNISSSIASLSASNCYCHPDIYRQSSFYLDFFSAADSHSTIPFLIPCSRISDGGASEPRYTIRTDTRL
ncbi:hypothetical protein BC939DRAFT_122532 [Gamsiella multidivaricata]|uniref:uncharacterized protein n=1 Tax=Gamsiella multidivaricata TaxID=101098 RepID=UPI00221E79EF|nr:uncharacterized protein BC939DRAFT_122532 [Gamsiella multidivaricata]KAI7825671.1 hypothetical protein BC939DRAFT_122532 [Gamsiella multidivaricata]